MIKVFIASAIVTLMIMVGVGALSHQPEQKHPGVPLGVKSPFKVGYRKVRPIVRAKFKTKVQTPRFGKKTKECNRILPTGGNCDGLQYHNLDWSGYASDTVHRGI